MITLEKAQNFSQDKLWNGVVDELRQDSLLDMMVFDNTASSFGNGTTLNYIYNRIDDYSGAAFRAINNDYTASESTTEQKTVTLKVLGGSYEIDRVILNYVKGIDEQEAFQMKQKIKAIKRAFSKSFITGDATKDATSFDGLDKLIDSSMILDSGANLSTAALITSDYTKLTDAFRDMQANFDGAPDAFLCSPEGYALIQKIGDRATGFTVTKDEFGRETFRYNGSKFVPIGDVSGSKNAVIPTTSEGKTAFYPVRIGLDAVHAISPEGNDAGIKVYTIDRNSSDAVRKGAVEMVTAIALKNSRTAGKILVQIASGLDE